MNFSLSFKNIELSSLNLIRRKEPVIADSDPLALLETGFKVDEEVYRQKLLQDIYIRCGDNEIKLDHDTRVYLVTLNPKELENLIKMPFESMLNEIGYHHNNVQPELELTPTVSLLEIDSEAAAILELELSKQLKSLDNLMKNLCLTTTAGSYSEKFQQLDVLCQELGEYSNLEHNVKMVIEYAGLLRYNVRQDKKHRSLSDEEHLKYFRISVYCFVLNLFAECLGELGLQMQDMPGAERLILGNYQLKRKRDNFLEKNKITNGSKSEYQCHTSFTLNNIYKNIAAGREQFVSAELRAIQETEA